MSNIILSKDGQAWKIGDYVPFNNVWGKGAFVNGSDFSQSVTFDNTNISNSVTMSWSWPTTGKGYILAYPEIAWGDSPHYNGAEETHTYVSSIAELATFDVDVDINISKGAQYLNVAFDLFLTDKPLGDAKSITTEVMVWLDKTANPWGTNVGTIGTGADKASIFYVKDVTSGGRVWDYIAVVYDKPHLKGEIDLKAILDALAAKNLVSTSDYVSGYHLGAEITGGTGSLSISGLHTDFATGPVPLANKTMTGTFADDTLTGAAGNDIIEGGAGKDVLNGGAGTDTLEYRTSDAAVTVDLASNTAKGGHANGDIISNFENLTGSAYHDVLYGSDGANVIQGLAGNDTIDARGGDDVIFGGAGNDVLKGGDGNDTIRGGDGTDRITGGKGADNLYGEAGVDWFVYANGDTTFAQPDHIYGFNVKEGDRIDIVNVDGDTVTRGYQRFDFIGKNAFTGHAGELRFEKTATETYIYADTNGDKIGDLAIVLDSPVDVTYNYFVV